MLAGCQPPPAAPAAAPLVATAVLTADAGAPTAVTVPGDAAQVLLRLGGTLGDVERLIAEVTPVANPDAARRWPVDAAPEAGDGARASVTLPPYVLPPGDYTVTVWEGDASVVQEYRFRVAR
jgi:hypothetical protein